MDNENNKLDSPFSHSSPLHVATLTNSCHDIASANDDATIMMTIDWTCMMRPLTHAADCTHALSETERRMPTEPRSSIDGASDSRAVALWLPTAWSNRGKSQTNTPAGCINIA